MGKKERARHPGLKPPSEAPVHPPARPPGVSEESVFRYGEPGKVQAFGGARATFAGRDARRMNLYLDPIVAKALATYCLDHGTPLSTGANGLLARALEGFGYLPPSR